MLGSSVIVAFAPTTDLDRAQAFYGDTLGLELVTRDGFACQFDAYGTPLRVSLVDTLTPAPGTVLGWLVPDVRATVRALVDRGVTFARYEGMGQDDDGYLYLTDRAVDMVIRGGVNVYPREIEDVLFRHPAVVDCAVLGVPDARLGEQLLAVVETRAPVTPDELRDFCREHLADFKVPATVELVDELPRQPNGKVLKRRLREAHAPTGAPPI